MHSTVTINDKYFLNMVYLDNKLKNIFKNSKYFIKETQKDNYPTNIYELQPLLDHLKFQVKLKITC